MFNVIAEVNPVAVIAAVLVFAVLGGVYFGAIVPKQYDRVLGRENLTKEEKAATASGAIFYVGPLVCSILTVLASAILIKALDITTVGDAIVFGLITGIGYLIATIFNIAINPLFPHPIRYGFLNAPYFLVANVIASILLVVINF